MQSFSRPNPESPEVQLVVSCACADMSQRHATLMDLPCDPLCVCSTFDIVEG